jgi:uncharacterized repeat protein (TIGR01451 family)
MRKLYILIIALLISVVSVKAQYVDIPDPSFRQFLQHTYPAAFNGTGQMDTTNASIVNETYLTVFTPSMISDWDGLQYFDNLTEFQVDSTLHFPQNLPPALRSINIISGLHEASISAFPAQLTSIGIKFSLTPINLPALPVGLQNLGIYVNPQETPGAILTVLPALPSGLKELSFEYIQIPPITSLPPNLEYLLIQNGALNSIPNFPATLTRINLSGNQLTTLPALPAALKFLKVDDNLLSSIPDLPASLISLYTSNNPIGSLPALPSGLRDLVASNNNLSDLPVLPDTLQTIDVSHNQLSSFPDVPAYAYDLNISYNFITSIGNFPSTACNGGRFNCSHNNFTSLNLSNNYFARFDCSYNQISSLLLSNAGEVNCRNNQLTSLPYLSLLTRLDCRANLIDCLPFVGTLVYYIQADNTIACLPNSNPSLEFDVYDSNGNFTAGYDAYQNPVPVCNPTNNVHQCAGLPVISGIVFNDLNNNGIHDSGEPYHWGTNVTVSNGFSQFTDDNGTYSIILPLLGSYGVTLNDIPSYFNVVSSVPSPVVFSNYDSVATMNFALQATASVDSLLISATPLTFIRAGQNARFLLRVVNSGTTTLNPALQYNFDNSLLQYQSCSAAGTTVSGGTVNIPATVLQPGERRDVTVDFLVSTSATFQDTLFHSFNVTANSHQWNLNSVYPLSGSFDPNDKQATPVLSPDQVTAGEYIDYVIRFQNTGNDTAFNVVLTDTLSANLIPNTMKMVASSHNCKTTRIGDNLSFEFLNINLPDSNVNEPKSHGFVHFRVKPRPDVPINTDIPNTASIYFDYNAPVVTNTAITHIANPSVPIPLKLLSFSVSRTEKNNAVAVWNTANEYNVKGYTLEMSGDGRNYQPLQFTKAKNQDYNEYREQLAIPSAEVLYFRLKMADKDGTITYSNVVVLRGEKSSGFVVLNSPVKGDIRLSVLDDRLIGTTYYLIDGKGAVLQKDIIRENQVIINVDKYPAGIYIIKTNLGTERIIKI